MRESPRIRRLRSDYRLIQQLREESSILEFAPRGNPPESYVIRFNGRGFSRPDGSDVVIRDRHEMTIELGAAYPRMQPELAWQSRIFHPNISANGVVCLGGYGTYWVPGVQLDELCAMLWDMVRYQNFDVESPYNREAATWAKTQCMYQLPIDPRPLRDRVAGVAPSSDARKPPVMGAPPAPVVPDVTFLDEETDIIEAEVIRPEDRDILFIE